MVYIYSNSWLLAVGSRDLSQALEESNHAKPEQIHKMTIIFTLTAQLLKHDFYKRQFLALEACSQS